MREPGPGQRARAAGTGEAVEHREPEREAPAAPADPPPSGDCGGISIGVLSGGAVAAGEGSSAEDSAHRGERPAPAPLTAEALAALPRPVPGGISIGVMTGGAAAGGSGARAHDTTRPVDAPPELAGAIAALRDELCRLARGRDTPTGGPATGTGEEDTAALDAALAEVQDEIAATGQVRHGRLRRLREHIELGTAAVAGLSSAAHVVQLVTRLLGGRG